MPDVTVLAAMPQPSQQIIAEPGQVDVISPSIIAMGEPAVADENVAAIGTETKRTGPNTALMVIRGGVVGDAFSPAAANTPATAEPEAAPQAAAEEPSSGSSLAPPVKPGAPRPAEPAAVTKPY